MEFDDHTLWQVACLWVHQKLKNTAVSNPVLRLGLNGLGLRGYCRRNAGVYCARHLSPPGVVEGRRQGRNQISDTNCQRPPPDGERRSLQRGNEREKTTRKER